MKQITQNIKNGKTLLEEVPSPSLVKRSILVKTTHSLVSLGTEKMLVEFSRSSILQKARQQPEKVKEVLDKIKAEGVLPTIDTVFKKLEEPIPLGYCNVGEVVDVADDVVEFSIGDRVASNGPHAEFVVVNKNLAAKVPKDVTSEDATFTVIGSVGLQGIRLLQPTIGETVVVFGLGLIGILTCQLLLSNGCKVIGIDVDEWKCSKAMDLGIKTINSSRENSVNNVLSKTNQSGCDGVIITASTKSNDLISDAAKMSRKRGRIVLVGVVGLNLNRSDFYEKELSFQVSCSYGPGRYDTNYENKGIDYPLPFVRWTEQRNFETVLSLLNKNAIDVNSLITKKIPLENFNKIYDNIESNKILGAILEYSAETKVNQIKKFEIPDKIITTQSSANIGIIGAGNFTKMTILPIMKKIKTNIKSISSNSGFNSTSLAKKYNIPTSTSDYKKIINDDQIDTVIIATRHDSHAPLILESLKANKHIFVEKPLAITRYDLDQISELLVNNTKLFHVGYNRRFSPHVKKIKNSLNTLDPINIIANMNAGFIKEDHWVHDINEGGGRIIGEACHLIDLCVFLTGSKIQRVCMNGMGPKASSLTDNASILIEFSNGSNAVLNYFSNGSKKYSKERVEVYSDGRTWILDNYRITQGYNVKGFKKLSSKIDKGHTDQFREFINVVNNGGSNLIQTDEILNVSSASIAAIESLKYKKWINLG